MAESFRIGVLGLTHDHIWNELPALTKSSRGELVAAAEPVGPPREQFAEKYQRPVYESAEQLFDAEKLDAVFVYSDNRTSVELGVAAARRGLHVMIEKPIAADVDGARQLLSAVEEAGVRLMVNWPFAWWPQLQHALKLAKEGTVGDIWQTKYRAAHAGPREEGCTEWFTEWLYDPHRNGGGALIDYCCYGALVARTLLGMPKRVAAVAGRLLRDEMLAEDNAVILMSYPSAIGISEASWTQIGKLTNYITTIYGSRGTLLVEPRVGGRLLLATKEHPEGEVVNVPDIESHNASAAEHFLHGIATGEAFMPLCDPALAADVQQILSSAYDAAESGNS